MKLLYTYFWKMLPVGALIWLAPIWLIWAEIAQPASNHLKIIKKKFGSVKLWRESGSDGKIRSWRRVKGHKANKDWNITIRTLLKVFTWLQYPALLCIQTSGFRLPTFKLTSKRTPWPTMPKLHTAHANQFSLCLKLLLRPMKGGASRGKNHPSRILDFPLCALMVLTITWFINTWVLVCVEHNVNVCLKSSSREIIER